MVKETGKVNENLEPSVSVEFENGAKAEFIIDTGFSGSLCLPRARMIDYGLQKSSEEEIYGIGLYQETMDAAVTRIIRFSEEREVSVLINEGNDFLLGSQLLDGKILEINYRDKTVVISD